MRCLTLAGEAAARGHTIHFIVNSGPMVAQIRRTGFAVSELLPETHVPEIHPPHASWLSAPWQKDAAFSAAVVAQTQPNWLIWDHYGLDARWVAAVRKARPDMRVLVLDDLDDRALGSDLVLDPARIATAARRHPVPAALDGPQFALLRPEFAALRPAALARRGGPVRRVLIAPGMMDAAGLAPAALRALEGSDLQAEVVMGASSQSVGEVQAMVARNPDWTLTLDAPDMAQRMLDADLCIGAAGGTSWERCCMGLPTVAVAVADNQECVLRVLAQAEAVVPANLETLAGAIQQALVNLPDISLQSSKLCDGFGAVRVLDAMEGRLRSVVAADAKLIFDWRNQPHIRAASHTQDVLKWDNHEAWFATALDRNDRFWRIYQEGERDLGAVMVVYDGDGLGRWSFCIGEISAPRGAGGRMLALALSDLAANTEVCVVEGEVLKGNLASAKLHERLGFVQVPNDKSEVLVFRKRICDHARAKKGHDT